MFRLFRLSPDDVDARQNLAVVVLDARSQSGRDVRYLAAAVVPVFHGEAHDADVLVAIVAVQLDLLVFVLIAGTSAQLDQFLLQFGPERSHLKHKLTN